MKLSIDVLYQTPKAWTEAVLSDFNTFLQDHANCERKAAAFAMSMVAKYPYRTKILHPLIDTAIEELEHFRDVVHLMSSRGVPLPIEMPEDEYTKKLIASCRPTREERFLDRLLLGSVFETRGAERFKLIYEVLDDPQLKKFYHNLWASEAKHSNNYVKFALLYFDQNTVYERLKQLIDIESNIVQSLPFKPALH
ncbi:MAG: tRNA-(ms[2]io[6]A)-hydroxylase [Cytophagaceae bacterium]|nr:tRNA-(ms[2]io[6]A)-hydroxylase [Cytophagaceae bacterium]MDW8455381.1 tRNA-(ms[2]io[6]A)-hydroxylase [Cytophagaceae bacterium]